MLLGNGGFLSGLLHLTCAIHPYSVRCSTSQNSAVSQFSNSLWLPTGNRIIYNFHCLQLKNSPSLDHVTIAASCFPPSTCFAYLVLLIPSIPSCVCCLSYLAQSSCFLTEYIYFSLLTFHFPTLSDLCNSRKNNACNFHLHFQMSATLCRSFVLSLFHLI